MTGDIMKHTIGLAVFASACLLPATVAGAVTINFDNLAVGTTLSNQYAAQGVTFSANAFSGPGSSTSGQPWATNTDMRIAAVGGDVAGLGTPSLVSGNLLHTYSGWINENGDPSFLMTFSTAITSISMDFAGVTQTPDTRLFVYNGATLLATVRSSLAAGGLYQYTLSYGAASITSVAVQAGSFSDWVGVDNIVFTPAVGGVPEPMTWATMVLGFGIVGMGLRRRRSVAFAA